MLLMRATRPHADLQTSQCSTIRKRKQPPTRMMMLLLLQRHHLMRLPVPLAIDRDGRICTTTLCTPSSSSLGSPTSLSTRVCRRWSEAVISAPSAGAEVIVRDDTHFSELLDSRLRSHVVALRSVDEDGCIELYTIPDCHFLSRVSDQMPGLLRLDAPDILSLDDVSQVCLALPRFHHLRELRFELAHCGQKYPSDIYARCMNAIGSIVTLHTLALQLPRTIKKREATFAPLVALTQLRVFSFEFSRRGRPSAEQIRHLRSLCSLRTLSAPVGEYFLMPRRPSSLGAGEAFLTQLLQPGHQLRLTLIELDHDWRSLRVDAALAAVLVSLPTLTSLNATMFCSNVSFLARLQDLRRLELRARNCRDALVDPDELVSALLYCTQIETLSLYAFRLRSVHMEQLLPSMPALSSLQLSMLTQLESLRCLSGLALPASLTALLLHYVLRDYPQSDVLQSLQCCSQIQTLDLHDLVLTSAHMEQLLPVFPRLAKLSLSFLGRMDSLRCFDTPALAASLTHLRLCDLSRCPLSELPHLFGLRSLQKLRIKGLHMEDLSPAQQAEFAAHSARFPHLRTVHLT